MPSKYDQQRPKRQPPAVPVDALRRSHGLTQPEVLAQIKDATGRSYTVGALSALEKGHRGGSEQFLQDIALVYGLTLNDIWTDYAPRAQAGTDEDAA